jgi:glucose/arabinose dehydrogenase
MTTQHRSVSRLALIALTIGPVGLLVACGSTSTPFASGSTSTVIGSTDAVVDATASSTPASSTPGTSTAPGTTTPLADIHLTFTRVVRLSDPIAFATRHGDPRHYVATQSGRVLVVAESGSTSVVLDINKSLSHGGEQGLLGLAFSPDGADAYVYYTDGIGDIHVDGYAVDAKGRFVRSSRRSIITIPHRSYPNHNGGSLVVDAHGLLYMGVGDGGAGGDPDRNGQNRTVLLGKILRIDPRPSSDVAYSIPADNPFVGSAGMRPEIFAYGLRNPWRFSFDRLTGDLWIGDVGQDTYEEIDRVPAADGAGRGANFGWSAAEAGHPFNTDQSATDAVAPVYEYSHNGNSAAVVGGYVYRGSRIPALVGTYLFTDEVLGTVWGLRRGSDGHIDVAAVGELPTLVSFGEDSAGELYALAMGDATGGVYRISMP